MKKPGFWKRLWSATVKAWNYTPRCEGCEWRDAQIAHWMQAVQDLKGLLDDQRAENHQLVEALTLSMRPRPVEAWPPATPEQLAAREQRDLKRMFEEKAVIEFPMIGGEPHRQPRTDEERKAAAKKVEKPYPAEFPAIG